MGFPVASIDRLRNNSVDFCYDIGVIDPPERLSFLDMMRPFNSLGCIVCRSGLYSLPFLAEERQDALENQY